ncbi:MAG: RluA family pseudouridine synthase [Lachnospiraceae bacterium]|nr:RluA family pseudouridine synthase [Lachnospiraceae bacterium]
MSLVVSEEEAGTRIDKYISDKVKELSRSRCAKLIETGQVFRNEEVVGKPKFSVRGGDLITIRLPEPEEMDILPEDIPLEILYEDSDVLVINKPKGMVVHPAPGHYSGTLVNALLFHCKDLSGINGVQRPGIVHRIDRDTTGSLLVCKNDLAHRSIADQLHVHSIKRQYRAIVHGQINMDGRVDAAIGRSRKDRKRMAVTPDGRRAVTHYHVLANSGKFTYLECELETGRTHQIRVHLSHIGHPVFGDPVYGGAHPAREEGQALHAMTLGFRQPRTGQYIEVSAPLPDYFQELLSKLFGING